MHFHVLGLGPIGSLISHHLRRRLPVTDAITLIVKNKEQGIKRIPRIKVELGGKITTSTNFSLEVFDNGPIAPRKRPPSYTGPANPNPTLPAVANLRQEPGLINSLVIASKAHQTLPAIEKLLPRLNGTSTIVLLQNGMGVYEELVTRVFRVPEQRPHFILASNTHGAYFFDDRLIHAGQGAIEFGIAPDAHGRNFEASLEQPPEDEDPRLNLEDISGQEDPEHERYASLHATVAALGTLEELNATWQPISSVELAMRRKVVVNSIINPLTAIMRCRNGDLFQSKEAQAISSAVCSEAARTFAAQIRTETDEWRREMERQGYSTEGIDVGGIPLALSQAALEHEVLRVAEATADNKSSMLADIERGRETEVEYLNGYLARTGATFGVPTPTVTALYNLVKLRKTIPVDQIL
ncbi:ketopantoate reductase PanE/ApbA C terminal-domain-containing protein [Coprinopsis sp. MPI-PUGE-AT-0042]|nr:ketopantoate reductase PanE/ApbA C terminal-domain-containing protein [Coprinopsis sp. MPI-PUGE-AT-0042]